ASLADRSAAGRQLSGVELIALGPCRLSHHLGADGANREPAGRPVLLRLGLERTDPAGPGLCLRAGDEEARAAGAVARCGGCWKAVFKTFETQRRKDAKKSENQIRISFALFAAL